MTFENSQLIQSRDTMVQREARLGLLVNPLADVLLGTHG
jgi:hypothetical protein